MVKTGVQKCGTNWRVILMGDANEIETKHWSFFNHGATRAELDWETETCAHFWSTPEKILKALRSMWFAKAVNKCEDIGNPHKLWSDRLRDVESIMDNPDLEYPLPLVETGNLDEEEIARLTERANENAKQEFSELESVPSFKPFRRVSVENLDTHSLGTVRAEKLDSDS